MKSNFTVSIGEFSKRHFIKTFEKKYKGHWDVTLRAITAELERIDALLETDRGEIIRSRDLVKIIKTKFRVAGTNESAKSSGNRCIVIADFEKKHVAVLLVYGKVNVSGKNETAEWISLIKEGYPEYNILFSEM